MVVSAKEEEKLNNQMNKTRKDNVHRARNKLKT